MKNFEICVRAIIFQRGKILVCRHLENDYYFFPGGHVKFGEKISETLKREVKEELGKEPGKFILIGIIENIFRERGIEHHEINFVFKVNVGKIVGGRVVEESSKKHIALCFFDGKRFSREKVLPIVLQKAVSKWQKKKKFFWGIQTFQKSFLKFIDEF